MSRVDIKRVYIRQAVLVISVTDVKSLGKCIADLIRFLPTMHNNMFFL